MYAFSFCLYGPETPKYYGGMLENLRLIWTHFPEWKVFIYLGADVPAHYIAKLLKHSQVILVHTRHTGSILMMHRFLALDEEGVECMIVRDADSRVHVRDRWAIHRFVASSQKAHAIRDHPYHNTHILGGLWGLKRGLLPSVGEFVRPYLDQPWGFGKDQEFLRDVLYPRLKQDLLVHTSQSFRYSDEETHEAFPLAWTEASYCGKAENLPGIFSFFRR